MCFWRTPEWPETPKGRVIALSSHWAQWSACVVLVVVVVTAAAAVGNDDVCYRVLVPLCLCKKKRRELWVQSRLGHSQTQPTHTHTYAEVPVLRATKWWPNVCVCAYETHKNNEHHFTT